MEHGSMELGFLRFATDGRLTAASQAASAILGFESPHELLTFGNCRLRLGDGLARGVDAEVPLEELPLFDVQYQRHDGGNGTCRAVVLCQCAEGKTGHVDAVLLNDTDRVESDPARTRQLLGSILEGLPNPVFVKDEGHRWILLNNAFCHFMGYPREKLLGKSDTDFFPPHEADVFWAKDRAVFDGAVAVDENEEAFTDATGRTHTIVTRKTLHKDASGRRHLLGVITDISERKRMEEELRRSRDDLDRRVAERTAALSEDIAQRERVEQSLRESEQRYRYMADAMPQIVWTAKSDGFTEQINVKWVEYTGQPESEAVGFGWQNCIHPDDLPSCVERWRYAIATGTSFETEYRLRRYDGVFRWHLARALPAYAERGEVCGWFGTATDIDDHRRLQETLKEEDQRKNEFIALLGHELRNPLNPIRVAASLLRLVDVPDPRIRRAQEIIERQVRQMARLIDDLLDISRVSQGKILLRKEPVDLVELTRTVLSDRRESIEAHGLTLNASLPASAVVANADPARVAQVVGNLLDNAEKYTDPGGSIDLILRRESNGATARISVRDSGIGLTEAVRAHLFEPFVQADRSIGRGRGGLGLGLWLVKRLIELHSGQVSAFSEGEGRGSEFVVLLPLPAETALKAQPPAPTYHAHALQRILIIEDNIDAADILDMALSALGHTVEVAHSGEEGLKRVPIFRPTVVLSDIGLPGMSGYEVARALRADPTMTGMHLVAITGYGQDDDQRLAMAAGFERHVTKPFDVDVIEGVICSCEEASGPMPVAST